MEDCECDEALELGSRTWNRVMESASKTGYRDGIDDGSQEVLQSDFDVGYEDGFKTSFILGKYKALAALNPQTKPPEIERILEATRRGACHICELESSGEINQLQSPEGIKNHKAHVTKVIDKLNEYFSQLLENSDRWPHCG
ncbi:uncharacterized protein LOC107043846 isoform X2 [Diachasma alloeum]|uniref:uncharacterized protein LOC107043846 isoform X2 n=1 Tax=Diachasma alloeum TaxID=454923 RepID=UPI00073837B9|nr:uncharacterized protein LOC107043846 isoform X2 [Diachasma alloeum]